MHWQMLLSLSHFGKAASLLMNVQRQNKSRLVRWNRLCSRCPQFSSLCFWGMHDTLAKFDAFFLQNPAKRVRFGASWVKCELDRSVTFAPSGRAGGVGGVGQTLEQKSKKITFGEIPLNSRKTYQKIVQVAKQNRLTPPRTVLVTGLVGLHWVESYEKTLWRCKC